MKWALMPPHQIEFAILSVLCKNISMKYWIDLKVGEFFNYNYLESAKCGKSHLAYRFPTKKDFFFLFFK